jgi:osmotically-inducible protein OsmY
VTYGDAEANRERDQEDNQIAPVQRRVQMFGSGIRDFDIHREVLSELDWSQDVHSTEVGVQVHSGIVTLSGAVSSPIKKILRYRRCPPG